MPTYQYRFTDTAGGEFEVFQKMSEEPLTTHEKRPCERMVVLPTVARSWDHAPIHLTPIADSRPSEIARFRKLNPGVEITKSGVPVVRSQSEKNRVLKSLGYVDRG